MHMHVGVYKAQQRRSGGQADQQRSPDRQPHSTSASPQNMCPKQQGHASEAVEVSQEAPCAAVLSELMCQEEAGQPAAPEPYQTISQKRRKKERQRLLGVCLCLANCQLLCCKRENGWKHCLDVAVSNVASAKAQIQVPIVLSLWFTFTLSPYTPLLSMHQTQCWLGLCTDISVPSWPQPYSTL